MTSQRRRARRVAVALDRASRHDQARRRKGAGDGQRAVDHEDSVKRAGRNGRVAECMDKSSGFPQRVELTTSQVVRRRVERGRRDRDGGAVDSARDGGGRDGDRSTDEGRAFWIGARVGKERDVAARFQRLRARSPRPLYARPATESRHEIDSATSAVGVGNRIGDHPRACTAGRRVTATLTCTSGAAGVGTSRTVGVPSGRSASSRLARPRGHLPARSRRPPSATHPSSQDVSARWLALSMPWRRRQAAR